MTKLTRIGDAESIPECDVVFVHGLQGDGTTTWTSDSTTTDSFWPLWLAKDVERTAIWSISYDIPALSWSGGTMGLSDRANNLLSLLVSSSVGTRPLAFISHSFGGLLVKQMIHNAVGLGEPQWAQLAKNVKGVVFLSTPHLGSIKADWFTWFAGILGPSVSTEELKSQDAQLRLLNQWYRNNAPKMSIATSVLYEAKATKGLLIVDPGSADPGMPDVIPIAMDADHTTISKPVSTDSHVYKAVRQRIRAWLSADFGQQSRLSRVVVRIDLGPGVALSANLKRVSAEESAIAFPDAADEFPKGSLVSTVEGALFVAMKKPSVALRAGIEFMQRWHSQVIKGSPDCRLIIDDGTVPKSGSPVFRELAISDLDYLPPSGLYVSEAIIDSADPTMATFSRISLPKNSSHSHLFRADFEDPRTLRDSSLIHALFVAHKDAESVRQRLFELLVIEYLVQNQTLSGAKEFSKWLRKRGLPEPRAGWLMEIIESSEYFEGLPTEITTFKIRDSQATQIEEHRKTFEEAKLDCVRLVQSSVVEVTRTPELLPVGDLETLIEEYLSAVFLEVRLMANYLRRTDQVFDSSSTPLKKFEYLLNRRLVGLSVAAGEAWRDGFIRGLKRAAEANNVYVASVFHNVLATYYLNRTQQGVQYQRASLQGRVLYIDTNVLYAARVQASPYHELVKYLIFQLRELGFDVRLFPFSVEEFEKSIEIVRNAIHDGIAEPWVLQKLPWIFQEFRANHEAYFTMQACVNVHSIAKKLTVSPADYDFVDEQLKSLGISLEREFKVLSDKEVLDLWSTYVNQMTSNKWAYDRYWEFRQNAMNKSPHTMRHDVLSIYNVQERTAAAGADEFGPKALFLTLDSDHLLRLRRSYPFIVGVQQCQEYFLPYLFLNDVPVKQVIEFPNQLLSAQLGVLLLKYRPKAIEFVESTLRSPTPWRLLDSETLPTAYKDVARSLNQDRLREKVKFAEQQPENIAAISEQIGSVLEVEAEQVLRSEYAARAKDATITELRKQIDQEKNEKARLHEELKKSQQTTKYFKEQYSRKKRK